MNTKAQYYFNDRTELAALMSAEYGEEVMCSGWNPQLLLASERPVAQIDRHINLLSDYTSENIDRFMHLMYAHQT